MKRKQNYCVLPVTLLKRKNCKILRNRMKEGKFLYETNREDIYFVFKFIALRRTTQKLYCQLICLPQSLYKKTEALIILWDKVFCSLSILVPVFCQQQSCHICFHLTIIFMSMAATMLLQCSKETIKAAKNSPSVIKSRVGSTITKLFDM